ncbi:hypothetical protein PQJ75_03755 [Rhodoplanes sp. TEM]|uniref:Uncharacterized protein n=1 Tax=Rhodoplanes tepidamans TaxID=200616 RepID=A0ABT5J925_RHOTP|nr:MULTISPECIES: hypothetical protein [Rhodoplanes]MDC7786166.1 hypothetical protein [Rhodoplanes tepidamans]MDC7982833.1 hypothetical protein [Rhodoplanes sp. TEM]MDQ0357169.1 hypothetical protein [Rhodoplanes tepidamans]
MRDQQYFDDLSVRAAMAAWRSGEAAFSAEMKSATVLTVRTLDRWLAFWDLDDRLRRGQRQQFLDFLETTARPAFCGVLESSPEAFALLDEVNFKAVREGVTTASLMALLTRFACSCEPAVYAPATQHSRRGIQILGRKLADMSYRSYMLTFMKERERFADRVATLVLAAGSDAKRPAMPLDVLVMRALDRRLMLAGGLPPERFEALLKPATVATPLAAASPAGRDLLPDQTPG